jgi:DNA polymerase III epsilon subunit-like protein
MGVFIYFRDKIDSGVLTIIPDKIKNTPNMSRVLIFDVETTGLLPKTKVPLEQCPYILQWSFVLYNLNTCQIEQQYDKYINVSYEIAISPFITELTGITEEMCRRGVSILEAMDAFYHMYMMADCIVAHNMQFDAAMVKIEMCRNRERIEQEMPYCSRILNLEYERARGVYRYCTMRNGTALCNIPQAEKPDGSVSVTTKIRMKWPKLVELYGKLFDRAPQNLHNSLVDVLACLRCLLKMKFNTEISDSRFESWLATAVVAV